MKYIKGFSVLKFDGISRIVQPYVRTIPEIDLISAGINPCDYNYLIEVIEELRDLIGKKSGESIWGGGERTLFYSYPNISTVTDNFGWSDEFQIPTSLLLELILAKKELAESFNFNSIKEIITNAFIQIKQNPTNYLADNYHSLYTITNYDLEVDISLILLKEDFEITESVFFNSLEFNLRHFPLAGFGYL
jgi:hypothetical protein